MNQVAKLNDHARTKLACRVVATATVSALGADKISALMGLVKSYDAFDPAGQEDGNNPYGERDFGAIDFEGVAYFWKIDYYADTSYRMGASNPADPSTARVLTVMAASDY